MKAGQRPGLSSSSRLSAGASLTIAALLGLYGTYHLIHREPADGDVLIDIVPGVLLNSDGPPDRPGRTERRTQAYNDNDKHQRYVSQIRDAEKADKVWPAPPSNPMHAGLHPARSDAQCCDSNVRVVSRLNTCMLAYRRHTVHSWPVSKCWRDCMCTSLDADLTNGRWVKSASRHSRRCSLHWPRW